MICDRCLHNEICFDEGKDEALTFCSDFLGWISISEKLPEEYKRVLFCDINGYILVGWHRKIDGRICFIEQVNHYRVNNVIAWMPLPPCYKPQESEVRNDTSRDGNKDKGIREEG